MRKLAFVLGLVVPVQGQAQQSLLIHMDDFGRHELRTEAFELSGEQVVTIRAVGAGEHSAPGEPWQGNAWIIDARTRDVVWDLKYSETESDGVMRVFEGDIVLPAGQFLAHYSSFAERGGRNRGLFGLFGGDDDDPWREFMFSITADGNLIARDQLRNTPEDEGAVVLMTGLGADRVERRGIEVSRPTAVEIYAIGEATEGSTYDYGWLVDANTLEPVWTFDYDASVHAGGATRNRVARSRITLEPGVYSAIFVTDGSHDASDWSAPPPYDPDYWGLTVAVLDSTARDAVRAVPAGETLSTEPIVSLTRIGNDAAVERGFSLTSPTTIRVVAVGESSRDRMLDGGWIVDADRRRIVWEMTPSKSVHAGGASRNRLVSERVELPPGNYLVRYTSDGSHSFERWSSAPPIFAGHWGITVLPPNDYDPGSIGEYSDDSNPKIVARLARMGNDERRSMAFELDREQELRVFAIGEGTGSTMHDFAWIEDQVTGRRVWEMEYGSTFGAGGATKNRAFDGSVVLPAGNYVLHYDSDGSHAFGSWNATRPPDPLDWGVTLFRVDEGGR